MSPHAQEVSGYVDFNVSMPAQNLWRVVSTPDESTLTAAGQKLIPGLPGPQLLGHYPQCTSLNGHNYS